MSKALKEGQSNASNGLLIDGSFSVTVCTCSLIYSNIISLPIYYYINKCENLWLCMEEKQSQLCMHGKKAISSVQNCTEKKRNKMCKCIEKFRKMWLNKIRWCGWEPGMT